MAIGAVHSLPTQSGTLIHPSARTLVSLPQLTATEPPNAVPSSTRLRSNSFAAELSMTLPTSHESTVQQPKPSFWRIVRLSLRGENHDYTAVPLNRAVLLLAVPMIFEMVMESLFAVANIFWVSRLGKEAVAIVGLTESVMVLISAVAIGLSTTATAIVARRIGEKDPERAAQAAGQILVLGAVISGALGLVLGFFAADTLRLMGAEETTVTLGENFARIMLGCNSTVVLIFLVNAIFRGAGDAILAMRTLWFANSLNIVLGPCFIFGWGPFPELGITGAAVATNLGRGAGVLYQLWHLAGCRCSVQVRPRHLKLVLGEVKAIMTTASHAIAQSLIGTASWIGVIKILALYGNAALAGYTIAIRIVIFVLLPAFGPAGAGATLVGQNLGAGKPARAEEAIRIAVRFNVMLLGVASALFAVLSRWIVSLFTSDPEVLDYGTRALWIFSFALPIQAAGLCLAAAFNGAGDTRTPTRINLVCLIGQFLLAWTLAQELGFGPTGIFIAVPISLSVSALWTGALFRQGRWKQQRI
jgi:putative MATE family efflux protein